MALLVVRVQPGAKQWTLERDDAGWKLRVDAPAIEGAANARAIELLAREILGVPRSGVRLVRGERSRIKSFEIDLPASAIERALTESASRKLADAPVPVHK